MPSRRSPYPDGRRSLSRQRFSSSSGTRPRPGLASHRTRTPCRLGPWAWLDRCDHPPQSSCRSRSIGGQRIHAHPGGDDRRHSLAVRSHHHPLRPALHPHPEADVGSGPGMGPVARQGGPAAERPGARFRRGDLADTKLCGSASVGGSRIRPDAEPPEPAARDRLRGALRGRLPDGRIDQVATSPRDRFCTRDAVLPRLRVGSRSCLRSFQRAASTHDRSVPDPCVPGASPGGGDWVGIGRFASRTGCDQIERLTATGRMRHCRITVTWPLDLFPAMALS